MVNIRIALRIFGESLFNGLFFYDLCFTALCDDVGGKCNVCGMEMNVKNFVLLYGFPSQLFLQFL